MKSISWGQQTTVVFIIKELNKNLLDTTSLIYEIKTSGEMKSRMSYRGCKLPGTSHRCHHTTYRYQGRQLTSERLPHFLVNFLFLEYFFFYNFKWLCFQVICPLFLAKWRVRGCVFFCFSIFIIFCFRSWKPFSRFYFVYYDVCRLLGLWVVVGSSIVQQTTLDFVSDAALSQIGWPGCLYLLRRAASGKLTVCMLVAAFVRWSLQWIGIC